MKNELTMTQMHAAIVKAQHILLVTHENPDFDAVSSVCAFTQYLDEQRKRYTIFFKATLPLQLQALAPAHAYMTDADAVFGGGHDLVITFDSGDFIHTGVEQQLEHKRRTAVICNIDHHPTNTQFGHHNLVWPHAVSTTEIIYHWYTHHNIAPTRHTATLLLAGILSDTNNFTNYNTTRESLGVAADLMRRGIRLPKVFERIQQKKSLTAMSAWGDVLSRLTKNRELDIACTVITLEDIEKAGDPDVFQGIADYLNMISDAKISMVIKETPNNVLRVSMRSNDDLIDVSKFAKMFNGGGHVKAAGFSLPGKLEKTETGWRVV